MTRLLLFALIVFAAWYGWHHYTELRKAGSHQILVVNHSGHAIERLRIQAGGQTLVVETLENGAQVKQPFRAERDTPFTLTWQFRDIMGERNWTGGNFSHGPILLAHRFEFRDLDGVIWSREQIPAK
jgi:hypothetical protein